MDFDTNTNYEGLLAPVDWENQTQQSPVGEDGNDESSYYNRDKEEEEEKYEKWLLWLNSDIFWKLPEEYEGVMLEIFSRLPPKSILRFKCLSKKFLEYTMQPDFLSKQFNNNRDAITGFFGQRSLSQDDSVTPHDFDRIGYINLKSKLHSLPDPMLNFVKQRSNGDMVRLIDSCNGLLLCIDINSVKTCFVCNPLMKEKVALPHSHRRSTRVNHALMADLDEKGYVKYKVVCLVRQKERDTGTEMLILSFETGKWEEMKADFPPMHHPTMMGSKVFFNGSLFWDCFESHILVCHLDKNKSGRCYDLIEAPRASLGRCLWKFHDKLVCYCHGYEGDFPAWSLSTKENSEPEWILEGCDQFETMSNDISRMILDGMQIKTRLKTPPQVRFKIIAYDPGLDMVYFWLKDSIFSYHLCNRKVEKVGICEDTERWHHGEHGWRWNSIVVAYRHSFAQIQAAKKGKAEKEETENKREKIEKDKLFESINEKDDEMESMYKNCANKVKPRRRKGKIVGHKGERSERDEEETENLLEPIKKDHDDFSSSYENCGNKVRRGPGKAKIDFSLLRLDDEE